MRPGFSAACVGLATLLMALTGCGSSGPAAPPFTASDSEVKAECSIGTFVPNQRAWAKLREDSPPRDWGAVETAPGAVQADRSAVRVDIRPRDGLERLTLTGIQFDVSAYTRPVGGVFYKPCGRRPRGPALEADLDSKPVALLRSNVASEKLASVFHLPHDAKRIRFPWTVSLASPFHMYIVVDADHCYCIWDARIDWAAGSRKGVIHVDNGGRRYRVVDSIGTAWEVPAGSTWRPIRRPTE
jgi:predicted small lipoprotein YifL